MGPLRVQKLLLLRQIRAINPKRHCSYEGQSVAQLKAELAALQEAISEPQHQQQTQAAE